MMNNKKLENFIIDFLKNNYGNCVLIPPCPEKYRIYPSILTENDGIKFNVSGKNLHVWDNRIYTELNLMFNLEYDEIDSILIKFINENVEGIEKLDNAERKFINNGTTGFASTSGLIGITGPRGVSGTEGISRVSRVIRHNMGTYGTYGSSMITQDSIIGEYNHVSSFNSCEGSKGRNGPNGKIGPSYVPKNENYGRQA